jgi:hypothetical protein
MMLNKLSDYLVVMLQKARFDKKLTDRQTARQYFFVKENKNSALLP